MLLKIKANQLLNLEQIPLIHFYDFYNCILAMVENEEAQIVHYLGYLINGRKMLMIVMRTHKQSVGELHIGVTYAPTEYLSFTANHKMFQLFEREIFEEYQVKMLGHTQLKPLRNNFENYEFYSIAGENVHQVAVGPVHAGVIEPGHFRFNCMGERVAHLEIRLGYQHRGIEKLLLATPFTINRAAILIEAVAGDSAVVNALTFSEMMESALNLLDEKNEQGEKDEGEIENLKMIRTLALELERLSNHIGDLGALSGDVAFLAPAAYFGRMRGEFLNLLLLLSGNRFGKGLIRPANNYYTVTITDINQIEKKLDELNREIIHVSSLLFSTQEIIDRFEGVGVIDYQTALKLGVVGVAARASGVSYDVRKSFLPGYYYNLEQQNKNINTKNKNKNTSKNNGDVLARAETRYFEALDSIRLIKFLLESLRKKIDQQQMVKSKMDLKDVNKKVLPISSVVVAINEGWRGEISHLMITDNMGQIIRYKIKDPSFHNWPALALAMRDQEISDFPLCNKSFNLSYCGFDL
ncbi:MAG: hydrogenase [Oligoflexia bacterium]|nr:hydrogenase [Oligoflexia bacterium]